jgi:hypothetical protein
MRGDEAPRLNLAQREVLERLGSKAAERPRFDPTLAGELRTELESRLAPIVRRLEDGEDLWLSKHQLEAIHGCEARFVDDELQDFEWSPSKARGVVAHKAIEVLTMRVDTLDPLDAVDEAIGSLTNGTNNLADWLKTCGDTARAEVRGEANTRVAAFVETWPPLAKGWRPVLEGSIRVELFDGRIRLAGKPDLTIGHAQGEVAGKVIVDFKTGGAHQFHIDDMRFYALIDTLRIGTPPRLLATSYLDSARLLTEDVTADMLWSSVERVVDAAGKLVTLTAGERDPVKRTGPPCRWCRLRPNCEEGIAFLANSDDEVDGLDPFA